eukprot:6764918-Heterocapsa_arctica.AAC.1
MEVSGPSAMAVAGSLWLIPSGWELMLGFADAPLGIPMLCLVLVLALAVGLVAKPPAENPNSVPCPGVPKAS